MAQNDATAEKALPVETIEHGDIQRADTHENIKPLERDLHQYQLKSDQDQLSGWQTVWRFRKAVIICTLLCIAAGADGYQISLNGNVIANLGFVQRIGYRTANGNYALVPSHTALWGAMQSLGQLIAMVFINPLSDRLGRKVTLYFLWTVLLGSLLMETFVVDYQMWAGAKVLAGFGVGAIQSTLPVYISEWAPTNIRGAMIIAYGVWNNIGGFLAPVVLTITDKVDPYNWRIPILTQFAFLGLMAPIFIYLPETPSFYAARGEHDKGRATLRRVNGNVRDYDIDLEYSIIAHTIEEEARMRDDDIQANSIGEIVKSYMACFQGVNLVRTLAASLPLVSQQVNGLSFLNTYSSFFFRQVGFANPFDITAILTGIKVGTILVLVLISDTVGRRPLVLVAGFWCTIMLFIVGGAGQNPTNPNIRNLTIAVACLWSAGSSTLGIIGWSYVGEVASQRLRARTAGLAAGISVLFGLTFNTSVPVMLSANGANFGYNTAWLFAGLGLIVSTGAIWLCPETARRSPAELDELYEMRVPAWKMRKYVTDVERDQDARIRARGVTAV